MIFCWKNNGGYWHSTEHMAILFTFVRWRNLLLFIALEVNMNISRNLWTRFMDIYWYEQAVNLSKIILDKRKIVKNLI